MCLLASLGFLFNLMRLFTTSSYFTKQVCVYEFTEISVMRLSRCCTRDHGRKFNLIILVFVRKLHCSYRC